MQVKYLFRATNMGAYTKARLCVGARDMASCSVLSAAHYGVNSIVGSLARNSSLNTPSSRMKAIRAVRSDLFCHA